MRKLIATTFIVLCVALAVPQDMKAQSYSNSLSADPLGLAFGMLNATFESRVGAQNSFTLFGNYYTSTYLADWTAFGFGGSYRWYFDINDGKRPIQGLSAGPFIAFSFWSWGGPSWINYDNSLAVAIGGEGAYKWVFGGFVVEPYLRLALPITKGDGITYRGYGLGCNLGFAW